MSKAKPLESVSTLKCNQQYPSMTLTIELLIKIVYQRLLVFFFLQTLYYLTLRLYWKAIPGKALVTLVTFLGPVYTIQKMFATLKAETSYSERATHRCEFSIQLLMWEPQSLGQKRKITSATITLHKILFTNFVWVDPIFLLVVLYYNILARHIYYIILFLLQLITQIGKEDSCRICRNASVYMYVCSCCVGHQVITIISP